MSIRRIQSQRVLEDVTRYLYASGRKPTLNTILRRVSEYFSKFPVGRPLPLPDEYVVDGEVSDVDRFNQVLAHAASNIDVLYEASLEQVDDVMQLTASLQAHLDRLTGKRKRIETKIDDYLLSLYNTDGYYYSISDTFSDLDLTDVTLTSTHVDTSIGAVVLSGLSALTKRVEKTQIGSPTISCFADGNPVSYRELAPFSGALEDSLSNIIWAIEVETSQPSEIIAEIVIPIGNGGDLVELSRIDYSPYGISPQQVFMATAALTATGGTLEFVGFGNKIETSLSKMSFNAPKIEVDAVRITVRKTQHDYTDQVGGTTRYRYVIGAKDISFFAQVYDNDGTFISSPLTIPADLENELVIDAISLVVDEEVPADTEMTYYIAADTGLDITNVSDLDWRPVQPVGSRDAELSIVRFDGAAARSRYIIPGGQGNNLALIPEDQSGANVAEWNPTPAILSAADTWRIAKFDEPAILSSIKLEEGVNAVRTYYIPYDVAATASLDFWKNKIDASTTRTAYGKIDQGNDFFYGGYVGESNVSTYTETYIESDIQRQTFLAELHKPDPFSQTWDVRVFLNGREIGYLPAGQHKAILPWTFQQGLNHIALLANIPTGKHTGTINLLGDTELYEYGTVKLATWNYVNFFDMQYNETGEPYTFTVHNGELISRRKPTTVGFRVTYNVPTGKGPSAVRLRADLSRSLNNPYVTPKLRSYRLRFAYGPTE